MSLWNTFDGARRRLDNQYKEIAYDEATGLSAEEALAEAEKIAKDMAGRSHIAVKAAMFDMVLRKARIGVDSFDWLADHQDRGNVLGEFRNRWCREAGFGRIAAGIDREAASGAITASMDTSHTTPDWHRLFRLGLGGLREEAAAREAELKKRGALTTEKREFLQAVQTVYAAMTALCLRLSGQAKKEGARHPEDEERMSIVSETLAHIAEKPPKTLLQAMQLAYIYHECQEFEGEPVRSMGGFDRTYFRFYEADLAAGRLTRDQAKELIKFFFNKFYARTEDSANGKNFYFGGELPNGECAVNDLSYLAFEAYLELRTVNPKMSVRIAKNTPEDFVRLTVDCVRQGCSGIVFCSDEAHIRTLTKFGKTAEEARTYVPIGCYEPAAEGKEMNRSVSATCSMPKLFELALFDGYDPVHNIQAGPHTGLDFDSYEALEEAFGLQAEYMLNKAMDQVRAYEPHWFEINPSPVLSGTMVPCLESGRDVTRGGTKFNNAGIVCGSMGTAVDSLAAVKMLVFDEKRVSLDEMRTILKNNWEGEETLRLIAVKRAPKWGNGDPKADDIACRLNERLASIVNGQPNTLGGHFQLAQFSIDYTVRFGRDCGATPDGRRRGELTSKNLAAMTAMDRRGVTAMIESAGRLDPMLFPDGAVLDCVLHPSAVKGKDGLDAFAQLVHTYFDLGGACIQFNVFDAATLRAAQKEPKKYASLQVRVCGWNVFFNHLSRAEQDEFVRQAEHEEGVA